MKTLRRMIQQGGTFMLRRLLLTLMPGQTSAALAFGATNVEQWRWEIRADAQDDQGYNLVLRDHKNAVDRLKISGFGSFLPFERNQVLGFGDKRWRDVWTNNLFVCAHVDDPEEVQNFNSIVWGKAPPASGVMPHPFLIMGQVPDSDTLSLRYSPEPAVEYELMSWNPANGQISTPTTGKAGLTVDGGGVVTMLFAQGKIASVVRTGVGLFSVTFTENVGTYVPNVIASGNRVASLTGNGEGVDLTGFDFALTDQNGDPADAATVFVSIM